MRVDQVIFRYSQTSGLGQKKMTGSPDIAKSMEKSADPKLQLFYFSRFCIRLPRSNPKTSWNHFPQLCPYRYVYMYL